ncbi:spermidine export protein MdtJ [Paenalcaligenes hominis]|uniref:Spermidine export protein MdtJ n=1 Tax=Paenalcaligenes hominis TaxID=643674 RepID=A0ABX0WRU9_9BURK|nr:SMR family transporter [Paenalcaligenes hominis]NJB65481.1 spermidine export protein MdtJ [Paenalcaligenes hominis]GGE65485.1 QacE family quaternary ammonium compound efflux SMR transporter [Paenalcaligenes hominis]
MHWVFLTLAIVGEVLGTSLMKVFSSEGHVLMGTLIAMSTVGISYLLLSQATRRISVTFANAAWEGLGMVLITGVSFLWLQEQISPLQLVGIVLSLIGIMVVHHGYHQADEAVQEAV